MVCAVCSVFCTVACTCDVLELCVLTLCAACVRVRGVRFTANGGTFERRAFVQATDSQGLGFFAGEDIKAGDTVFTLPADLRLSVTTALARPDSRAVLRPLVSAVREALEADGHPRDSDVAADATTILVLVYEALYAECGSVPGERGNASHWAPYFALLPREPHTPLRASAAVRRLRTIAAGLSEAETLWTRRARYLAKVLSSHAFAARPDVFGAAGEWTWAWRQQVEWGMALLRTRSYGPRTDGTAPPLHVIPPHLRCLEAPRLTHASLLSVLQATCRAASRQLPTC